MADIWQHLAAAVACRIEFERRCSRGALLDESGVVRFAAEFFQAEWKGDIRVGEPHPDLAGKFIDLVGTTPQGGSLNLALEAKWLKNDGGDREWMKEIACDVFRLQHLTTGTAQGCDRVVLAAGTREMMRDHLWTRSVHTGLGSSVLALPIILPRSVSATMAKFQIRQCAAEARQWLKRCHTKLGAPLPSTFDASMAGHYRTWIGADAVEVAVWVCTRPQGWGSFDAAAEWP